MQNGVDEKELIFQLIEQACDYAAFLVDLDGRILWANGGAAEAFGRPREEFVGMLLADTFVPEDRKVGADEIEETVALASGASPDDRWHLRADGSRFWASGVLLPLRDENGVVRGFGKLLRNRTDIKEQLMTLANQIKSLEEADERKNTFLATLAHELRNPLAPLTTAADVLRQTSPDDERVQRFAGVVQRQVDTITRLVDDMLDIARLNTGKMQLRVKHVAMQTVVGRAIESAGEFVARHAFRSIVPPAPVVVDADEDRLCQVLVNLLGNAAKFTPIGGTILLSLTTEGEEAVVRVSDSGVGIAPDMLTRIFDMFTQAAAPVTDGSGLGIGLAVARDLVTLHGGTIQAVSDGEGKGSVFSVRLPLVRPGDDSPR